MSDPHRSRTSGAGSNPSFGQANGEVRPTPSGIRSDAATTIAILGILIAGIAGSIARLAIEGQRVMARSDEEFDRGRLRESTLFARRAASLYAPGLNHVRLADARLDAIAAGAESARRDDVAILAWQAIRSTELQRSLVRSSTSERARRAEQRLAVLLANGIGHSSLLEQQQISSRVLAEMTDKAGRSVLWYFVRSAALFVTIVGVVSVHRGIAMQPNQKLWLYSGGALLIVGVIAWAILLQLA